MPQSGWGESLKLAVLASRVSRPAKRFFRVPYCRSAGAELATGVVKGQNFYVV